MDWLQNLIETWKLKFKLSEASDSSGQITKEQIEEYFRLDDKRKSFSRQARALEKQQDIIESHFLKTLRAEGKRNGVFHGFLIAIGSKKILPQWKNEFIKAKGAEAAEQLIADAPSKDIVLVEPAQCEA